MSGRRIHGWLVPITLGTVLFIDRPVVWALYWGWLAISMAIGAIFTWRRAGLFWLTVTSAYGSVMSAVFVPASLAGYTLPHLTYPWIAVFWGATLIIPVLVFISWLAHGDQMKAWEETHPEPTLRDILLFRNIPDFRSRGQS